MFGLRAIEIFLTSLNFVFIIVLFAYLFKTISFRNKFLTVNLFENSTSTLPGILKKLNSESIIQYARDFSYKNQFFLTDHRFVFYQQSLMQGKTYTKYFKLGSLINIEITYKNPYGWLILAGLNLVWAAFSAISEISRPGNFDNDKMPMILLLIFLGLFFSVLWYYLKGFYLILDNRRITGLFCRSSEGLEDIIKKFDNINLSEKIDIPENIQSEPNIICKDLICDKCKSIITLEDEDLKKNSFKCPVCGNINPVIK